MKESILYDMIRSHTRNGATPLVALHKTLQTANAQMLPFLEYEKKLHVAIDGIFSQNISILVFLSEANFLKWKIEALQNRAYITIYSN